MGLFGKKENGVIAEMPKGIPCKKPGANSMHVDATQAEACCGTGKAHDAPDPKIEADRAKQREAMLKANTIRNLEAGIKNAKGARSFIEIGQYQGRDAIKVVDVLNWLDGIARLFDAELMDVKNGRKNFGPIEKK